MAGTRAVTLAGRRVRHAILSLAAAGVLASIGAAPVNADEVTAKGTRVRGKVSRLTRGGVSLEPEYGEGSILIRWKDVEDVTTDGALYVQYGDDGEVVAPVRGKIEGALRVGDKDIDIATISAGEAVDAAGPSWKQRLRSQWRFWHGNIDVGFNYQQSTIDTSGLTIGFDATRAKAATRLTLGASYRYSATKDRDQPRATLEDEIKALVRGEYDLSDRIYAFASDDVQYDTIQRLRIRSAPKAGAGYTIYRADPEDKLQNVLSVEIGGGWVYQKFFGGGEDNYFAVAFGLAAAYTLPYESKFSLRADYLPAIDDWANRYLLRETASLTVPMFDPVGAKIALVDEYDNKPAVDASRNSLYLTAGLSAGW